MLLQQLSYLSYELIDQRATTKLQYEKISRVLDNYRDHDPAAETRASAKARRANQSKSMSNAAGLLESAKAQSKVFNAN
jgi:type III secretory pathway lipoprotein EscJ